MNLTDDLTALLASVKAEVEECGPGLALAFLNPGIDVAWDVCCGGQLWIRVVRMHPVNPLPQKVFNTSECGYPLGVQIAVGIIRCQSGLEILDVASPKAEQFSAFGEDLTADASQMLLDMAAIYRVLCGAGIMVDMWTPLGPKGGCYGGEWTAWLEGFNLPECGEESESP